MKVFDRKPKLIAFMNSYSQGKSGGDMVFIEVAKRLKGYDLVVVTSRLGKKLCQECSLSAKFITTTSEDIFSRVIPTYLRRTVRALRLGLKVGGGDILLGTSDFLPDTLPIYRWKRQEPKAVWVQHVFHLIPSSRPLPFLAQRISFQLIKRGADLIVVDNSLLKDELTALGFDPGKVAVNYPGIDLGRLSSVRPGKKGYQGVFIGQLRRSKGIFDLVPIWRAVTRVLPEARMGIIGKGSPEMVRKLTAEIARAGLAERIDLLGYLADEAAWAAIKGSKVFVFPSHEEGFGIAPLEAQALGLPVVAWDLPVFAEIFPQGIVRIKLGEVELMAAAVVKLLTAGTERQRLVAQALGNARRFSWEAAARKQNHLLEDFIGDGQKN